jgi:hypothetical protein
MSELLAKLRQHLHIPKALRPNADELLLECLHAIERLEYEQLILDTKRSIANLAFQEADAMKRSFPLDTRGAVTVTTRLGNGSAAPSRACSSPSLPPGLAPSIVAGGEGEPGK